jgi:hypothetical protein
LEVDAGWADVIASAEDALPHQGGAHGIVQPVLLRDS